MLEWPTPLVNDIARRRCIIVIGSGVSKQASSATGETPPLWKEFLKNAVEHCPNQQLKHVEQAIADNDLLHACEWLKNAYEEEWASQLRKSFSDPIYKFTEIHEQIVFLDARVIFSLNFDKIMENALNRENSVSHVKHYYDTDVCEFLRGNKRYIVKLHGTIDSPDNLIFTQKDYSEARVKYSSFYSAFDASLLTNTFLFIGCGYSDPDTNLLLENQSFGFPNANPHYFLTNKGMDKYLMQSLRRNRNLKVIEYEKIDDSHSGLVSELRNLNELVDAERQEIRDTINW